jgi:hypothetical protein
MKQLSLVVILAMLASCGRGDGAKPDPGAGSAGSAAAGGSPTATPTTSGSAAGSATVTALAAPEPTPAPEDATLGPNLALAVLGGRIATPAESADREWRVSNLLDGFPVIRGLGKIETSLGWRSEAASARRSSDSAVRAPWWPRAEPADSRSPFSS